MTLTANRSTFPERTSPTMDPSSPEFLSVPSFAECLCNSKELQGGGPRIHEQCTASPFSGEGRRKAAMRFLVDLKTSAVALVTTRHPGYWSRCYQASMTVRELRNILLTTSRIEHQSVKKFLVKLRERSTFVCAAWGSYI